MGQTLLGTICTLMNWAYQHSDQIDPARADYDARAAGEGAR